MFKANDDKPYRVFFPEPVILHGTDEKRIVEVALEYLRQPGRVRVEPLFAPALAPPTKVSPPWHTFKRPTCKGCYALGTACGHCEKCGWEIDQRASELAK